MRPSSCPNARNGRPAPTCSQGTPPVFQFFQAARGKNRRLHESHRHRPDSFASFAVCLARACKHTQLDISPQHAAWRRCRDWRDIVDDACAGSKAARATAGFTCQIESGILIRPASCSMTGKTRQSSSASLTGSAPGRVDSPPMSKISAPCPISFNA